VCEFIMTLPFRLSKKKQYVDKRKKIKIANGRAYQLSIILNSKSTGLDVKLVVGMDVLGKFAIK